MSVERRFDLTLDEAQLIELTRALVDEGASGALAWMRSAAGGEGKRSQVKLDIILEGEAATAFSTILEDGTAGEALGFLHDHLEEQLKLSRNPHCVPVFEACYQPDQADSYLTDAESG